jgi:hypothetical protein
LAEIAALGMVRPEILPQREESAIRTSNNLNIVQIILLVAGGAAGVAFSDSGLMFYNILLMPVCGGIAFAAMGRKWFLAPLVIFALAGLKQTVTYWGEGYLDWAALSGILLFGLIYAGLVCLGAVITGLLKYAWGKDG